MDKEFIHIHIGKIGVKVDKKGIKDKWLPLGKYLTPIGFDKPYSDFSDKEEKILNKKINKIFENFLSSLLKNPNKEFYINDNYINKSRMFFKNYFKNGVIESLKRYVSKIIKNEEVNEMTLRNRILLSLSYYPVKTFFDIDIKGFFNIPDPGDVKRGYEIIHKIYEFHKNQLKEDRIDIIKEIEENEISEKESFVKKEGNKIFIRGKEYFFKEIDENFAKNVYSRLHYLSSYRKNIKSYGIVNKDDLPVAIISIANVERNYKRYCLNHDGVKALEFTRAYNALYKVKGILSFLFSKVRQIYPDKFFLTAYQPNFSSGINIYGSGFSPYIIKPQQNFFIFKTFKGEKIPVFTVRRELRNKTYEIGKMPLIPSFEMIYPNVPWLHYVDKILD